MATKSKKKIDDTPAKVHSSPAVGGNKKPKEKDKIHHSQVTKKKKKKISSKHPLAKNAKKNSDLDDEFEVDDSIDDIYAEGDVPEVEEKSTFDIESISSDSVAPTSKSDDIVATPENLSGSTLTLEVPNISVSDIKYSFNSQPDGTQRVTASIPLEEVFRSEDYEVRISS